METLWWLISLCLLHAFVSANQPPVSGDGKYSILLSGTSQAPWGQIGTSTSIGDLIQTLGGSWTVELWFSTQNASLSSPQPIFSHQHSVFNTPDRNNDFNLQLRGGYLEFFMGNGLSEMNNGFGIYWRESYEQNQILSNTWYHIALVFEGGAVQPWTPSKVTVYMNGRSRGAIDWMSGVRQLGFNDQPFTVGRYDNQDIGVHVFQGRVDELRLWKEARSNQQIAENMRRRLDAVVESNLVAYYTFDQKDSLELLSETGAFDGLFRRMPGGDPIAYSTGAPLDSFTTAILGNTTIIALTGTDIEQPAQLQFSIAELPTQGRLYLVTIGGNVGAQLTAEDVGKPLPSNKVAYFTSSNATDSFKFYATDNQGVSSAYVSMWIAVQPAPPPLCSWYDCHGVCNGTFENCTKAGCDGGNATVDACGLCGGEAASCECASLSNWKLEELDRIMIHWNIEYTLRLIAQLEETLTHSVEKLFTADPATVAVDLQVAIDTVQHFNSECVADFKDSVQHFLTQLSD